VPLGLGQRSQRDVSNATSKLVAPFWPTRRRMQKPEDAREELARFRGPFHFIMSKAVQSKAFQTSIVLTIVVNMITIALETLAAFQHQSALESFKVLSWVYLAIYTVEFMFKILAEPWNYWKNNYNRMDFVVLVISYITDVILDDDSVNVSFLKIFRALRALRALRSISFIRPLQVLVVALLKTMASIVYLVALLLLLMFVWGIVGHYSFGREPDSSPDEWGTIWFSMYQLWVLVTLDSWTDIFNRLIERNFSNTTVFFFVVPWIFVGNFIFTNLFIGVVVQNLEEAQNEEKAIREQKRAETFKQKKLYILEKQKRDLEMLMKSQERNISLDEFLQTLAGTLKHSDIAPIKTICCSKTWFETYIESLHFYENGRLRNQRLQLRTAMKLNELVERRMVAMSASTWER